MHKWCLIVLAFLCGKTSAQIDFEPGYLITNDGVRINVLIKYAEWRNNPVEFQYKRSQDEQSVTGDINTITEFGINGLAKYERHRIKVDTSGTSLNSLSRDATPEFRDQLAFLNVLVEGKATLFYFREPEISGYFFRIDSGQIEQLVHKKYKTDQDHIRENVMFRQQLANAMDCGSDGLQTEDVDYNQRDLTKVFNDYNRCADQASVDYVAMRKRDLFNLAIRPGLNLSTFKVRDANADKTYNYDKALTFRLGIEAEFILPVNKDKWAILVEPTYQYYSSVFKRTIYAGTPLEEHEEYTGKFSSIELPFGVRYYLFLNKRSKIFLNALYTLDFIISSELEVPPGPQLDVKSRTNFAFGVGFKHSKRLSAEIRYYLNREELSDYLYYSADYSTLSLIIGFALL